jgi:hypothetical protein
MKYGFRVMVETLSVDCVVVAEEMLSQSGLRSEARSAKERHERTLLSNGFSVVIDATQMHGGDYLFRPRDDRRVRVVVRDLESGVDT